MPSKEHLSILQHLPLPQKLAITMLRIKEWYEFHDGNVVVSYSGGKDSTALLHICRSLYPDIKAVFSNTGLEYPEIQQFVKSLPNVDIIRPKMPFSEVISTYGYPIISKEVAEAIYYARRIKTSTGGVEKTPARKRVELQALRESDLSSRRRVLMGQWITKVSEERECSNRRIDLLGERPKRSERKQLTGVATHTPSESETSSPG